MTPEYTTALVIKIVLGVGMFVSDIINPPSTDFLYGIVSVIDLEILFDKPSALESVPTLCISFPCLQQQNKQETFDSFTLFLFDSTLNIGLPLL